MIVRRQAAPRIAFAQAARSAAPAAALVAALLLAMRLVHLLEAKWPTLWALLAWLLALALCRARYGEDERPSMRLLQLVGVLAAVYGLLHYPLMPVDPGRPSAAVVYAAMIGFWLASLAAGAACMRIPSLALIPAAYLVWSVRLAGRVTGLPHDRTLDIAPLAEVALCLGVGLGLARLAARLGPRLWPALAGRQAQAGLAMATLMLAVAIHLANYVWSAVEKLTLDGPVLSWLTFNNPIGIYLSAIDNGYVVFSPFEAPTNALGRLIDGSYLLSNAFILGIQAIAIAGFLLPRWGLVALLLAFDAMHVAIAVVAGANFWPWVLLNVAIAVVVARPDWPRPTLRTGLLGAAFVLVAPAVAEVARLGWYDSGANNKAFLLAETDDGRRLYVSPNSFTFYSYTMAHMTYGMPEPETAFATHHPNGGTKHHALALAGRACDTAALVRPGAQHAPPESFAAFVRNTHAMLLAAQDRLGGLPTALYPHHFYVRPSLSAEFDALDKHRVRAYIYRRESVCLSFDSAPHRWVVSAGEMRIEVAPPSRGSAP